MLNSNHITEVRNNINRAEINFKYLMARKDRRVDSSYKIVKGANNKLKSYTDTDFGLIKWSRNELRIMIETSKVVLTALSAHSIPTYENRLKNNELSIEESARYNEYLTKCLNRVNYNKELIKYFESKL